MRLQVQSLELLKALMERPGLMVGREELRHRLWPDETFVDFEHGLNAAVRRLREALGDSADAPRFIETIPRKGYRLVADTDMGVAAAVQTRDVQAPPAIPHAEVGPTGRALSPRLLALLAAVPVVLAAGAWLWTARPSSVSRPPVAAFTIDLPAGWQMRILDMLSLSPDSRYVAFTAVGPDSTRALWVRPLAGSAARQIVSAGNPLSPFWSPDSTRIGFFQLGQLSAVSLADTSTQVLAVITQSLSGLDTQTITKLDISDPLIGGAATWMDSGDIVFTPLHRSGLERLASGASTPKPLGDTQEYRTPWPQAVPGTDRFTFVEVNRGASDRVGRIAGLGGTAVVELGRVDSRLVLVAYHSAETGSTEVFVETFPAKGGRWQVTSSGAIEPMWREDGRELFFLTSRDEVAAVEVFRSSQGVQFGPQRVLFKRPGTVDQVRSYAPFPDGQRFVVLAPVSAPKPQQIQVRVNWRSGLPAK